MLNDDGNSCHTRPRYPRREIARIAKSQHYDRVKNQGPIMISVKHRLHSLSPVNSLSVWPKLGGGRFVDESNEELWCQREIVSKNGGCSPLSPQS